MNKLDRVVINYANIRYHHFYLGGIIGSFSSDSIGGGSKKDFAGTKIEIALPSGEVVVDDVAGDKKIFRGRSWVRRLYEYRNAQSGDFVVIKWVAPYRIEVDLEKKEMMLEGKVGKTIQIFIEKPYWLTRKKFDIPAEYAGFIPLDALGAREEKDIGRYPERGVPIEFDFGFGKSFCDVATRASGVMRPRDNSKMGEFMKEASIGDVVCLTRVEERVFKVILIKR